MADIVTRSTVMAIKPETTEGTPLAPAGTGDYVRLQDGFDMAPQFETLENAELSSSIGRTKSILGSENPTFSFSHYLRNSGSVATAPDWGEVLKAAFGSETIAGAEYNTVAASTVSVVKVDTGEGATFERGEMLLVKDGTNGYSIRPVHSIATEDLTLGFNLANAPGTGVNLGRCVLYKPADTGHQSLSIWNYLGNSGAVQMATGCRVTSLDIQADAGQLINCSISMEGIGFYFNPVEITSSNNKLDFTNDTGTEAATIPSKWYKDPHELADAIAAAMNLADPAETHTVVYSDTTGKFTISCTGTVLSLLWQSGANTANTIGATIGFDVSANDTGTAAATGYTADDAMDWSAPHTPAYDAADPIAAKNLEVLIGDATDTTCFEASSVTISLGTPKVSKPSVCAESGIGGSLITSREATVTVSGYLSQYDAQKFKRFRENEDTRFLFNFGTKVGGNWVAGKCGGVYIPTATISSFNLSDTDGLVAIDITLSAFVDGSGNGEIYLGFV